MKIQKKKYFFWGGGRGKGGRVGGEGVRVDVNKELKFYWGGDGGGRGSGKVGGSGWM